MWFFFLFPASLDLSEVAGPEKAKNLAGQDFRLIQIRLTASFEKIPFDCQAKFPLGRIPYSLKRTFGLQPTRMHEFTKVDRLLPGAP